MIKRILIANRGEIALRIIRACKAMSIEAVAVYAKGDDQSLHVRMADQAVCIGAPGASSYMNQTAILSAAEMTQAEAIHPGYGFLSENHSFSRAVSENGLIYIGPSHALIELMGDKINAIDTMRKLGVPTIPGSSGCCPDEPEAQLALAEKIGYPVLIKAASGGGGRGMKPVFCPDELVASIQSVQAQAEQFFGDRQVYLERYLQAPRHIEVQVLADQHGQVFVLGDRDCSIQRRHQKLIEEAPAFDIPHEARKKLFAICQRAMKKIGYIGVGTIELLYEQGHFYFIEMNTRIQVEHPVTEMVTRVDLIQAQIRAHLGEKLSGITHDITPFGHAIECRINAEDPQTMQPSPGTIQACHFPGGPGVRVDSHVFSGYRVEHYYDSLIAKVIVHAADRPHAIRAMQHALYELHISGIATNASLHQAILDKPGFQQGTHHIHELKTLLEHMDVVA